MAIFFVKCGSAGAVALALALAAGPAAAEVKVNGATTVTFGLMKPHKEQIEQKAGATLAILPSSTTRGLTDLAQGRADIAMLAEPLETAAESVNKKQPGTVDADQLVGKHVGNAYVQFIVHPSNPVQRPGQELVRGRRRRPAGPARRRADLFAAQVDRGRPGSVLSARPARGAEHQ